MALVTLSELKSALGIASGDTSRDTRLTAIIAGVAGPICSYLGWDDDLFDDVVDTADVSAVAVTEYLAPLGAEVLTLRKVPPRCPVTLTAVWEATKTPAVFDNDNLLTAGTDYTQERPGGIGIIRLNRNWLYDARRMPNRLAAVFLPETGTVKVTYTLKATKAKATISNAALMECMAQASLTYDGKGIGLVTTDSMDGASVTINTSAKGNSGRKANSADGFASPAVAGMLDSFRMIAFV